MSPTSKPLIKKDTATGEMVAGFLDTETGVFTVDMEIKSDSDIDIFMEKYDLPVVIISKM